MSPVPPTHANEAVPAQLPPPPPLAAWPVLGPIRRNLIAIVASTLVAACVGLILDQSDTPVFPVRAELLVRIGYEYTPAPTGSGGEYQQVTFRSDEVIGTEIQILSSVPLVERALTAVPHAVDPTGTEEAPSAQQILRQLAVKRIEGSNIISLELVDADADWSREFLETLVALYLEERARAYSQAGFIEFLDAQKSDLQDAVDGQRSEIRDLVQEVSGLIAGLSSDLQAWSQVPASNAQRTALEAELLGLRAVLAGLHQGDSFVAMLDAVQSTAETGAQAANPAREQPSAVDARIRDAVGRITEAAMRVDSLDRALPAQQEGIETVQAAILRLQIRDAASRNVAVLTPPYQLETPTGLPATAKAVALGAVAFFLTSLIAILLEAGKPPAASGRSGRRQGTYGGTRGGGPAPRTGKHAVGVRHRTNWKEPRWMWWRGN